MRRAPPPYIGASATKAKRSLRGRSPRRYSATSGAVKKSTMAAEMLRWERFIVVVRVVGAVYIDMRYFPLIKRIARCDGNW
jgi:hypothetical protein